MWVATQDGFFSVVARKDLPDVLTVRTRHLADANGFAKWLRAHRRAAGDTAGASTVEVIAYQDSDYPWRCFATKTEWSAYMVEATAAIDYTNFKDRVTVKQGQARHNVYAGVWCTLLGLEKLPGAMRDHAKRAVPHPARRRWPAMRADDAMSQLTLGELAELGPTCEVCDRTDGVELTYVPDGGDSEYGDDMLLCTYHRRQMAPDVAAHGDLVRYGDG